jgi:hypothetical protein
MADAMDAEREALAILKSVAAKYVLAPPFKDAPRSVRRELDNSRAVHPSVCACSPHPAEERLGIGLGLLPAVHLDLA